MSEKPEEQNAPVPCAAGCGFFGNPASENLCSKCFRDLKGDSQKPVTQSMPASPAPAASPSVANVSAQTAQLDLGSSPMVVDEVTPVKAAPPTVAAGEDAEPPKPSPKKKKKKNRCKVCRKNVGLLGFTCRCEGLYCPMHRHAEEHDSPFDYKTMGRDKLIEDNPMVKADKFQRL